jgi:GTP-binding nuclear protein Ran
MFTSKIYKVVLIGDGCVGKTSFVNRVHNPDSFDFEYIPTRGVDITSIEIDGVAFDVWDCAGQEEFEGLRDGYFVGADCVIIMCDERIETIKNMVSWKDKFKRVVKTDVPIEYVFNDCNSSRPGVRSLRDKYNKRGDSVTDVCVKNNTNIVEVFRKLITKLKADHPVGFGGIRVPRNGNVNEYIPTDNGIHENYLGIRHLIL